MCIIRIEDSSDPRIAGFRDIKERDLTGRLGRFVAEGEVVLRVLTAKESLCALESILLAENRVRQLEDVLGRIPADVPVYAAPQGVLDAIAGFHLHRGILALGVKPSLPSLPQLLAGMDNRAVVVAVCGIGNHDNMGGLFRNAAAFGAAAVVMDDRCCDPFYRKAIRVSVGAVLRTPMAAASSVHELVDALQAEGFDVLALTPSAEMRLADFRPSGRTAILLGAEGPGLDRDVISRCRAIGIPMKGGFDSLNVAATSAVALHHVTTA
jgi:tRNA G18 (ribose-2'-O)-methylase SpoU